jgi:hypothetical protein
MTKLEREHYNLLRATRVPWEQIVGAGALSLLDEGFKLELEGATNPECYSPKFPARVAEILFGGSGRPRART